MKHCNKCGQDKEEIEFGSDVNKKDGLNSYCKECIRKRSDEYRKNEPEYFKKYAEKYRKKNKQLLSEKAKISYYVDWESRRDQSKRSYEKHREEIAKRRADKRKISEEKEKNRIRQRKWRSQNKTRIAEIVSGWKKRHAQKAAAHTLVFWAIRSGILTKPLECEECKLTNKIEAHHEDYFKPLEVKWLCKECHTKKHRIYR